jgi:hypothetical protein
MGEAVVQIGNHHWGTPPLMLPKVASRWLEKTRRGNDSLEEEIIGSVPDERITQNHQFLMIIFTETLRVAPYIL